MKKFFILPLIFLFSLIFTNNVHALDVGTGSFDLYYLKSNSWKWQHGMLYGNGGGNVGTNYVQLSLGDSEVKFYQFNTSNFTTEGNYASMHFETNIVLAGVSETYLGRFVNLPYIKIQACNGTGAFSNAQVLNKSISYATTVWNNGKNTTLTLYGDVSFRNVASGSTGKMTCQIGNPSFSFVSTRNTFSTTYANQIYFEKNPIKISFSSNVNDALLQNQINQNSTIINQNSTVIKNQNEIKDFLKDGTAPSVDTNKTPSVGLLPPGVFDSIINMPLNLMNVIVSSLGGSCNSITAPLPYVNKNLTLPCFSETIYKGDFKTALDTLSIPVVAIIFYGYFKKIKERFERAITMNTTEKDEWGIL